MSTGQSSSEPSDTVVETKTHGPTNCRSRLTRHDIMRHLPRRGMELLKAIQEGTKAEKTTSLPSANEEPNIASD